MENTDLSAVSTDELLIEIKKRRSNDKSKEILERNKEIVLAYQRCLGHSYIKEISDGNHYETYRKISDPEMTESGGRIIIKCAEQEKVVISCRLREVYATRTRTFPKRTTNLTVHFDEDYDASAFIQKDSYPITEEEYLEAKGFAIQQIKQFNEFFEKDPECGT